MTQRLHWNLSLSRLPTRMQHYPSTAYSNTHQMELSNPVVQSVSCPSKTNTCRNCGGEWPHTNNPCPAKNKACRKCNKLNNFAKVCHFGNPHNLCQHSARQQHQRCPSRNNIRLVNTPANDNKSNQVTQKDTVMQLKQTLTNLQLPSSKSIIKSCNSLCSTYPFNNQPY